MVQRNQVLAREGNRISLVSARQATRQEGCISVAEIEIPVNATGQSWILEVEERAGVTRTTPNLGSFLVGIIRWLYYLGSGQMDSGLLEARHRIHDSIGAFEVSPWSHPSSPIDRFKPLDF